MGMGLQERGAGTYHFPTLAPRVARRTDRLQTSLWRGQLRTLRQRTLSCGLSSAVQIEDPPSLSLPIPETSHTLSGVRGGQGGLPEHTSHGLPTSLADAKKEAA